MRPLAPFAILLAACGGSRFTAALTDDLSSEPDALSPEQSEASVAPATVSSEAAALARVPSMPDREAEAPPVPEASTGDVAAGERNGEVDAGWPDSGSDVAEEASARCGPLTCLAGCCLQGSCMSGTGAAYCGSLGNPCADCRNRGGGMCSPTQACE